MARISGINIPLNKRVEIGLTYVFGSTPAFERTSFDVDRPTPYTYVSPISTLLLRGMLIPAMRAI